MKQAKPQEFNYFDEYKKEIKRDNKKHKQLRDQRKSRRSMHWSRITYNIFIEGLHSCEPFAIIYSSVRQ